MLNYIVFPLPQEEQEEEQVDKEEQEQPSPKSFRKKYTIGIGQKFELDLGLKQKNVTK